MSRWAPAGAAAVAFAVGVAGAGARPLDELVYSLDMSAPSDRWHEWIAVPSSAWRIQHETRAYFYDGFRTYASFLPQRGWYVRTGSLEFVGSLADQSVARRPLESYLAGTAERDGIEVATSPAGETQLSFRLGTLPVTATIQASDLVASARDSDLFQVPGQAVWSRDAEKAPGAPSSLPMREYWLGRRFQRHTAVDAVEHSATLPTRELAYAVFYELPSAHGGSGAFYDRPTPHGQVTVVSVPRSLARRDIRRLRFSPRRPVRLAAPERGLLATRKRGVFVLTRTTLVSVTGSYDRTQIPALVHLLRPVA